MGVETVSLVIAAFVNASLSIAALLRNFRSRQCVSFALMAGLLFAHDALSVLGRYKGAGPFLTSELLAIFAAGPAVLWFLHETQSLERTKLRRWLGIYGCFAAALLGMISLPVYEKVLPVVLILTHVAFILPAGVWLVELRRSAAASVLTRERLRLRYAYLGGVGTSLFFLTDLLYLAGSPVPPLGTLARTLYLFFLFHTFIQKELMTAEEVAAKAALFGGVALMLSTIFSFLVSWVGDQRDLFFFNTLIASVVIIVLFDPIRNFSAGFTRRLLLRSNAVLENRLRGLSQDLRGVVEPSELARRLGRGLATALDLGQCDLYLLDRDGLSYMRFDSEGRPDYEPGIPAGSPLVEYMTLRRGRPFVQETVENDKDSFHSAQPRRFCEDCLVALRELGADFVLPFLHEGRILGFCAASTGERIILSNEQLRLFIPVCRQVATQLRNARALQVLRDRDKLAAVGEMAAGLAHEIKNPLGSIKGAAQLLGAELSGAGPGTQEYLKIIQDETDRLSGVLSDFLDYAKPRRWDPRTRCNPVHVVEHVAALILQDSRVPVEIESAAGNVTVEADPDLLKQVLLNLMINGVQAMEGLPDPRLTVRIRELRPRPQWPLMQNVPRFKKWEGWEAPSGAPDRAYVEIEVADTGVGIHPDDRDRIFVPFYTSKPRGTGLGLAVCQRVVESMGGTIQVRPNRPAGSIFAIHLPVERGGEGDWTEPGVKVKPRELSV